MNTTASAPSAGPGKWTGYVAIAGAIYCTLFCVAFYRETLPNTGVPRTQAWQWFTGLIPGLWPPLIDAALEVLSSPHMSQRVVPLCWAAWVLATIWAAGLWARRLVPVVPGCRSSLISVTFGLGAASISTVTLVLGLFGLLHPWLFRTISALLIASLPAYYACKSGAPGCVRAPAAAEREDSSRLTRYIPVALLLLVGMLVLLGSLLPATDFDVREYHLQGPKEYFLAGRIGFLPHNVYTNMPFGTEMLTLFAMVCSGDWWWGALAGQAVLGFFPLMTVLAVRAVTRHLFGAEAAAWATVIGATVPWFYRIGIIPYAEGGYCFYTALSLLLVVELLLRAGLATSFLLGFSAGAAFSCKYPALLFVTLPAGAFTIALALRHRIEWLHVGVFCAGVLLTAGPWLVKNAMFTGNPVYPLAYEVFGGRNWTPEKDAKWDRGHSVPPRNLRSLMWNIYDVTVRSDWQSPLVFALAPLALFRRRGYAPAVLWALLLYLFACWWLFTHRIDRFWLPLEPVACVLAGAGAAALRPYRPARLVVTAVAILAIYFNLNLMASPLAGNNAYGSYIDPVRRDPLNTATGRFVQYANVMLDPRDTILCVGAADLFHANRRVLYNTVFDDVIFLRYLTEADVSASAQAMKRDGITYVFFCWEEVERYRTTYGWDERVMPHTVAPFVEEAAFTELWRTHEFVSVNGVNVPRGVLYRINAPASRGSAGDLSSEGNRDRRGTTESSRRP